MGKNSPSPPAAPDPVTTSAAQAKYNQETALYTAQLNDVNQVTPYGNLTYSMGNWGAPSGSGAGTAANTGSTTGTNSGLYFMRQDRNNSNPLPGVNRYGISQDGTQIIDANTGMVITNPNTIQNALSSGQIGQYGGSSGAGTGGMLGLGGSTGGTGTGTSAPHFTSTITLSPQEQAIFDEQMANQKAEGALAGTDISQAQAAMANPIDYSKFTPIPSSGDLQDSQNTAMKAQMNLLDPELNLRQEQLTTQLANEGLSPGSEAWKNAWQQQNGLTAQTLDNATLNAQQYAALGDQTALANRGQQINEAVQARELPLNEAQALMGGSQVTNPQFAGPQGTQVSPTNYLSAVQQAYQAQLNSYNAQTSSNNAAMGGLFGLGGSFLSAAGNAGGVGALLTL